MATEIERKFLVVDDSWKEAVVAQSVLKQGYVANQPHATVRVRIDGETAFLTIKSITTCISRAEFEYQIPVTDAEEMLQLIAEKPFIDKTRYKVRCGEHIWDLDVFDGENLGLVVAEVELSREDEVFQRPSWAGNEVSGDVRYYNSCLVKAPYNQW